MVLSVAAFVKRIRHRLSSIFPRKHSSLTFTKSEFIQGFKILSQIGSICGAFPHILLNSSSNWKFTSPIPLRLYTYLFFAANILTILQVSPEYLAQNSWGKRVRRPTDRFSFFCFLTSFFILRILCYGICLIKASHILKLVQKFQKYDQQYRKNSNQGTKIPQVSPFCIPIYVLIIGTFITIVSNYLVTQEDFKNVSEGLYNSSYSNYYLIILISGSSSELFILFNYVAHSYCEVAFLFYMTFLIYVVRSLEQRLLELQEEVLEHFNGRNFMEIPDWVFPIRKSRISGLNKGTQNKFQFQGSHHGQYLFQPVAKFKKLVKISRELHSFAGGFVLVFVSISQFTMIVLLHVVLTTLISTATNVVDDYEDFDRKWDLRFVTRGIFALVTAFIFLVVRVGVLVNAAEQLNNVVSIESNIFMY